MDVRELCAIVREAVPTMEVARALGLSMDQHGRCPCPFHHGHDRNMKVYPGTRGFYCFVCHESGDCIRLVAGIANCSYSDAMWWINDAFQLGLRQVNQRPNVYQRNRNNRYRMKKNENERNETE